MMDTDTATARATLRTAKRIAGLTWDAMAKVLSASPDTVRHWLKDPGRQPHGPGLVLAQLVCEGPEAWSPWLGHRIARAAATHPDERKLPPRPIEGVDAWDGVYHLDDLGDDCPSCAARRTAARRRRRSLRRLEATRAGQLDLFNGRPS